MAEIETRRVCVLSMAHLTLATYAEILAGPQYFAARMSEDMLIAWVPDERGSQPDDLWACLKWAAAQEPVPAGIFNRGGFDYIMFDRDVDPDGDGSGLPDLSQ